MEGLGEGAMGKKSVRGGFWGQVVQRVHLKGVLGALCARGPFIGRVGG